MLSQNPASLLAYTHVMQYSPALLETTCGLKVCPSYCPKTLRNTTLDINSLSSIEADSKACAVKPPHACYPFLGVLIQDEDLSLTLSQLVETKRGIITVASEALALLGMTPFIYIEICTVLEYGPKRWLSIWNLMDLATYFLQV